MKITFIKEPSDTFVRDNTFIELTSHCDDIHGIVEDFRSFLMACGYHPNTVMEALPTEDMFYGDGGFNTDA